MSAELHLRRGWDGYQLLLTAPLQVVLDGESVGPIGMRASNEYSIEPGVHTLEVVKGRRRLGEFCVPRGLQDVAGVPRLDL